MIKINAYQRETGDILTKSQINGKDYDLNNPYIPTNEEGEILPQIYKQGDDIIFNHQIDQARKHVTFIHMNGNAKRFLDIDCNGIIDIEEFNKYVDFYNMTDEEQCKYLTEIKAKFWLMHKGKPERVIFKLWIDKGRN